MCSEFVNLFMPLGCSMIMYATYFCCSITNAAFFFFHSFLRLSCYLAYCSLVSNTFRFDGRFCFASRLLGVRKRGAFVHKYWLPYDLMCLEWDFLRFSMLNYWIRYARDFLQFCTIFKLLTQPQRTTLFMSFIYWMEKRSNVPTASKRMDASFTQSIGISIRV